MKTRAMVVALVAWMAVGRAFAVTGDDAMPERVRIGVDIRLGLQSCIEFWTPITKRLSEAIPEHRFVIVPLASHQDVERVLESRGVDFLAIDSAVELMAEDRFGVSPLTTMVESNSGHAEFPPADAACSGAIIRRADRADIQQVRDLRGMRLSAVKPWSLTGWFAQWGVLARNDVDPYRNLKQVVFEGTHGEVLKSVLDGSSDAGALDANLLLDLMQKQRIPDNSLWIIDRRGIAVPLAAKTFTASTPRYPGRLVSKAATTSDELAKRVVDALVEKPLRTTLDGIPCQVRWTAPSNTSKVRRLLQSLLGPQFAMSDGYPTAPAAPAWLFPLQVFGIALGGFFLASAAVRSYYRRRERFIEEQFEDTRRELIEVRAENQRIDTILALAGCGVDIVDDQNQIVYADASLEHKYGDWHGHTCHDFYCGSDTPCPGCPRPFPINEHCQTVVDPDCTQFRSHDLFFKFEGIQGEATRMIGVPFRDEGGRWLHARVHLPMAVFAEVETV